MSSDAQPTASVGDSQARAAVESSKADPTSEQPLALLKAVTADSSESLAKLAAIGGAAQQLVAVVQWLTDVRTVDKIDPNARRPHSPTTDGLLRD